MMDDIFAYLILYGIPCIAFLLFSVCLMLFIIFRVKRKHDPAAVSQSALVTTKVLMIVTAVLFGLVLCAYVIFYVILLTAVSMM